MASSSRIDAFNRDYLHAIGADGRYNRDRLFAAIGVQPDPQTGDYARVRLTDPQRRQMQALVEAETGQFGKGIEIDPAGNMNENEGVGRQLKKWGPIAGAAALTAFGIPGTGFGGLFGGGGGGAGWVGRDIGRVAAAGGGGGGGGFWGGVGRFLTSPGGASLIGTGGDLGATWLAGRSNDRATDAQSRATREALDWEKSLYADDLRFFEPYAELGRGSVARLSDLSSHPRTPATAETIFGSGQVGRPSAGQTSPRISDLTSPDTVSTTQPVREPVARAPGGVPASGVDAARSGGSGLVRVQAPTGEVREVSADLAERYIRLGARRVA